ncbi:hypothetical protein V502_03259 [Pseudogymnoascus sp. VKM F-4520 (FW-2644)]|nr:hypothetical protein V502_03259 [Pseudogymnoascus sp. VKM F-4520 (FW-2644)]
MNSYAARRLALNATRRLTARSFHTSPRAFVKAGDAIPDLNVLVEGSPGNKINMAEELSVGKSLIIGVPAAFSPGCSNSHIPGFMKHSKIKDAGNVFVVTVNDAFVTKAWAENLDPDGATGFRFIGDPACTFTKALDLDFDGTAIFGNERSKRYALLVEDGKVKQAFVEPDNTGIDVSAAEKVLG